MSVVILLGTLDTKGTEYGFLRDQIQAAGLDVLVIDAGILGEPQIHADVSRESVARESGAEIGALVAAGDRGAAIETMANGATMIVRRLHAEGRLDGILGLGGSGGSALIARAMRSLPLGVPKVLVSTMASGDTRPYVGVSDLTMMHSVVDIAGINAISERIFTNAAAAITGMVRARFRPRGQGKPLVGATMFGVTTPCVTAARARLEELGYEVLVFHATGSGGRAMEGLITDGFITAALDITTTELADDLVGGVLSAGPDRLEAAGARGIPQVVSLGALDMVNFGPHETVPPRFRDRLLYKHNPTVTLMRTTADECAELGRRIAAKLNAARGPVALFVPRKGVSLIAMEGGTFYDPAADEALFGALRRTLAPGIEVIEMDKDINDPQFAGAMADRLHAMYQRWAARGEETAT